MYKKALPLIAFLLILFHPTIGQPVAYADSAIVVIENVNVLPMTEEVVLHQQRVVIANGKILTIEPASLPLQKHAVLTIDGTGKYLMPALSEMHYHLRGNDVESDLKLLLANGIATVRNMAEREGQNQMDIKRRTLSGALLPVNYFTTGPYLTSKDLPSVEAVAVVVKQHKETGYDFLKIADNLPKNIYLKLLETSQANGIPVVGHAQRALPPEYSLRMKSIEHIEEFGYLSKDSGSTSYLKQNATNLQKLAIQLQQSGICVGTTLSVFEFITNCLDDDKFDSLQRCSLQKYVAKEERKAFLSEQNDYRQLRNRQFDGLKATTFFNNYFLWMKRFVHLLSIHHVHLLTGCDTYGMVVPGFSLHREFELLQQAGMRPYDILLASTVTSARYLNTYSQEGTLNEGKNANLVLLNKNPLTNIKNTQTIQGVFLRGKWFDRAKLDSMLKEVAEAYR